MNHNTEDIKRYFNFLDSDKEVFNYALFDAESKAPIKGKGICFGTKEEILHDLEENPSSTLHVTLNRTNIHGRRNKDVESCRVACVDIDEPVDRDTIKQYVEKYKPQLVVESSPGKYHLYWKLHEKVRLDEWLDIQAGLAWLMKADLQLPNLGHLIRVPGVSRVTKDGQPFMPTIVYDAGEPYQHYTLQELNSFLPEMKNGIEAAKIEREKKRERVRSEFKKDVSEVSFEQLALEKNRNETLYSVVRESVYSHPGPDTPAESFALQLGEAFNEALGRLNSKGALGAEEVEATAISAWASGCEARAKRAERQAKKLEAVREVQVAAMNGHADMGGFDYDFEQKEQRINRYTDLAVLDRVKQRYREKLCVVEGNVYAYDDQYAAWIQQIRTQKRLLRRYVDECINDMVAEEGFAEAFGRGKNGISPEKLAGAIARWKSAAKVGSLAQALMEDRDITNFNVSPFDKNASLLFCKNGVLDLETKEFRAPEPQDYLRYKSEANYEQGAKSAWWIDFLKQVFRDNSDPLALIDFLQEVFGYSLTGNISEQMIFVHYGGGANGKSLVLSALSALCGQYLGRLQPDSLGTKKNAMAKALERVAVKAEGKRVVLIPDLETGLEWNEGMIKSLTDEVVVGRRLFEEERDIKNTAKIHICCNEIPKVQNSSHAVYRRLAIIEYARRFEVNPSMHREIGQQIKENLSGILNWAIEGLDRIKSREGCGIVYPEEVRQMVEEYEEANSGLEQKIWGCLKAGEEWKTVREIHRHIEAAGVLSVVEFEKMNLNSLGMLLSRMGLGRLRSRKPGQKKETRYSVTFITKQFGDENEES